MAVVTKKLPTEQINQIIQAYNNKQSNVEDLLTSLNVSMLDFYKYISENNIPLSGRDIQTRRKTVLERLPAEKVRQIIELYKDENVTTKEIIRRLNINGTILYKCIEENNIPYRDDPKKHWKKALTAKQVEQLIKLYKDPTVTTQKISEQLKVSYSVWQRYLKENNIPQRGYIKRQAKKILTPDQVELLIVLYQDKTIKLYELDEYFKISPSIRLGYLKENNVPLRLRNSATRKEQLTAAQAKAIIAKYKDKTINVDELCRSFSIHKVVLYALLRKNNIPIRDKKISQ